jgi:hypothetical protein
MAIMTNQKFCYWLQGYFELSEYSTLNARQCKEIERMLYSIQQPLGEFTAWLETVMLSIRMNEYHQPIINSFCKPIEESLNAVFYHVIDPQYNGPVSLEDLLKIHAGQTIEQGAAYD